MNGIEQEARCTFVPEAASSACQGMRLCGSGAEVSFVDMNKQGTSPERVISGDKSTQATCCATTTTTLIRATFSQMAEAMDRSLFTTSARLATFHSEHRLEKRRASNQKKKSANTIAWPHNVPTPEDVRDSSLWKKGGKC